MGISNYNTILIIEDDVDILFALQILLEDEGYNALVAANGAIALEMIKKNGIPRLILLDMMMPVMNGWQFSHEFTTLYDHQCPIIVMTGAADAQQRAKDVGAVACLEKPFNYAKFLDVIKEHMQEENRIEQPI